MMTENISNVQIDEQKVARLIKRILNEERKNLSTKEKNDIEMVKLIKKMIEEEAKCY